MDERQTHTHTQTHSEEHSPHEDEGRDWGDASESGNFRDCYEITKNERGVRQILLHDLQREWAQGLPGWLSVKNQPANTKTPFHPLAGKIPYLGVTNPAPQLLSLPALEAGPTSPSAHAKEEALHERKYANAIAREKTCPKVKTHHSQN